MANQIYFMQETSTQAIKIGYSGSLRQRELQLQHSNPSKIIVLGTLPGGPEEEARIHERFAHLRIRGEWHKPADELLEFISMTKTTGNVPVDLGRAVLKFEGAEPTEAGKQCKELMKMAENLPNEEPDELLSVDTAAALLGISRQTLRNWDDKGRITSERTEGNHRRYSKKQIINIRKQQMHDKEILILDITPNDFLVWAQNLVRSFDPTERINFTIRYDTVAKKVRLSVDSTDGFTSVKKGFNIKD